MKEKIHNSGTTIGPDTKPEELKKSIGVGQGEKLRNSSRREAYLQKVAGLVALRDLVLYVRGQGAHVKLNKETPEINVTGERHEQPTTDISEDEFDLLVQEVLTIHECGHILFSDWESFERYMNRVSMNNRHLFKHIWNAAEDGAIERQSCEELNVRDDFRVMYANLHESQPGGFGIEQDSLVQTNSGDDSFYKFPIAHATITAILDLWQDELYDESSGSLERLLDPDDKKFIFGSPDDRDTFIDFLPKITSYVEDMLTQPKARKRNKRTWDFWEDFQDLLEDAQVTGKRPLSDSGGGENGMPDDAQPGIGEDARDADDLEEGDGSGGVIIEVDVPSSDGGDDEDEENGWGVGDEEDEDEEGEGGDEGEDEDADGDEEDEDGSDTGEGDDEEGESDEGSESDDGDDQEGDEDDSGSDDGRDGGNQSGNGGLNEAEERVQERYSREIDREAEEVGGDNTMSEAEEFLEILKEGNDSGKMPDPNLQLVIPESDSFNTDRYRQAKNDSRALARLWEQKLQQQQKTQVKHGKRFGTPDSRSMSQSGRSTKVFKTRNTPDKKDYECMVVLDRSSSMSGQLMRQAERSAGALLMSLYSIGVDVSMISLESNEAVLEVPFGADPDEQKNIIFTGATGGSTPLSECTYLARHRMNRHATKTRFMLVITDGRPDKQSEFVKQVNECNFPVLGVEIGGNGAGNPGYDRSTEVPQNGNILSSLRNLVNEVMF